MTHKTTFSSRYALPNFRHSFIPARPDIGERSSVRDVVNGEESGQAAFGKAGGDSRHWATVGFPKEDRILEMAGLGSRSKTAKTAGA